MKLWLLLCIVSLYYSVLYIKRYMEGENDSVVGDDGEVVETVEVIELPKEAMSVEGAIRSIREKVMNWGIVGGIVYNVVKAVGITIVTFSSNSDASFGENMAIVSGLCVADLITTPINYPLVGLIVIKVTKKYREVMGRRSGG